MLRVSETTRNALTVFVHRSHLVDGLDLTERIGFTGGLLSSKVVESPTCNVERATCASICVVA
jgi:hypothetical protein